ncbi:hypothetical protein ACTXGQ_18335 [Marinobacter sp. 1Y8]
MVDLEIYIRSLTESKLTAWLSQELDQIELESVGSKGVLKGTGHFRGTPVRISVYPEAFSKHFSSIVLEGEELPWNTDVDCARSAWRSLEIEVRCSPGDWKEGDPVEEEKWWRIDERGEQKVVWN